MGVPACPPEQSNVPDPREGMLTIGEDSALREFTCESTMLLAGPRLPITVCNGAETFGYVVRFRNVIKLWASLLPPLGVPVASSQLLA